MLTHPKEQGLSNTQKQANKQAKQQKNPTLMTASL